VQANDNEIEGMVKDVEEGDKNELEENVISKEDDYLSDMNENIKLRCKI